MGARVLAEDADHVRVLTMNRPDKLNAFNTALFAGLADALEAAAADDEVRVVVLTGAGRAFTAGADLAPRPRYEPCQDGAGEWAAADPAGRLQQTAESFPKPLVAAVNGVGVGLGFTILGYCDFAFIAQSARLRTRSLSSGSPPRRRAVSFSRCGWGGRTRPAHCWPGSGSMPSASSIAAWP